MQKNVKNSAKRPRLASSSFVFDADKNFTCE